MHPVEQQNSTSRTQSVAVSESEQPRLMAPPHRMPRRHRLMLLPGNTGIEREVASQAPITKESWADRSHFRRCHNRVVGDEISNSLKAVEPKEYSEENIRAIAELLYRRWKHSAVDNTTKNHACSHVWQNKARKLGSHIVG